MASATFGGKRVASRAFSTRGEDLRGAPIGNYAQSLSASLRTRPAARARFCCKARILARRLVLVGLVAATLLVVPLAGVAYKLELNRASWLFPTAQHRVVIWGYTSGPSALPPRRGSATGRGELDSAGHRMRITAIMLRLSRCTSRPPVA
jgi:hypothetical protein